MRNLVEHAPDIEANLSFIVGLPGETQEDRRITFHLIERLAAMSPNIRCSICIYMPYPGTPLWPEALAAGYRPPENQESWAEFDLNRGNTPWVDDAQARAITEINDILFVGRSRGHWVLRPYYALLRWRWYNLYFNHYWEGAIKRAMINSPLRPLMGWMTRKLVTFNANTHKGTAPEAAELLG